MNSFSRRRFLATGMASAVLAATLGRAFAQSSTRQFGAPQPFSYDGLRQTARELAARAYMATPPPVPDLVAKVDFDAVQKIRFRADRALWGNGAGPFPVRMFPVDKFNSLPVRINTLGGGMARQVLFSPDDFDVKAGALPPGWPPDTGYSGFRILDAPDKETDWLAFQGASYYRASGDDHQYGASARGIAVNTGLPSPEEFPRFVEFWLAEPARGTEEVTIYALLDGPSVTGAYRFDALREEHGAVITISAELFMRGAVSRLGMAPLTSMYWYGENDRRRATDWRPEVHDSDGLALWTGAGERIWRPLINPASLLINTFADVNPRGFGLLQRDRRFSDYEDDGAFYNRRPSIWIEPVNGWGEGAVQLVEIPTADEIHDNVVAFWTPRNPVKPGDSFNISYRQYWRNDEPHPPTAVARVVATRIGGGGIPGKPQPGDENKKKFVIDFEGGPLAEMAPRYDITPMVTLSRGSIDNEYVVKVVGTNTWRAVFDVDAPGTQPVDMRCFLRLEDKTLTETWLYHYMPTTG